MILNKVSKSGLAILFLLLIVITSISSCKKEDEEAKQAAIDHALIEQYVADNQLDGKFTLSGLYYVIEEAGNGEFPYPNAIVKVTYKGYLLDGSVFDEGHISASPLTNFIPGWVEGIQLIDEGGRIKLIIPSNLAYGPQSSEDIPQYSVLIFDVTLHAFEK